MQLFIKENFPHIYYGKHSEPTKNVYPVKK